MIKEEDLITISYKYYPRNISSIREREIYHKSKEHSTLKLMLTEENNIYSLEVVRELYKIIEEDFETKIEDHTLPSWLDRCYNWQFVLPISTEITKKMVLCLNISKLIPFYIVYVLEVEFDSDLGRLKYSPRRNIDLEINMFNREIEKMHNLVQNHTECIAFPDKLLDKVIEDINFQDIPLSEFTMFNAFFLNNYLTKFS